MIYRNGLSDGVSAPQLGQIYSKAISGAALPTVVGVLIEVPVMLTVVWIVNRSEGWYEGQSPEQGIAGGAIDTREMSEGRFWRDAALHGHVYSGSKTGMHQHPQASA